MDICLLGYSPITMHMAVRITGCLAVAQLWQESFNQDNMAFLQLKPCQEMESALLFFNKS